MKLLENRTDRRLSALFLVVAGIALTAALVVGISDNVTGLTLLYAAGASFVLVFTHRWRSVKSFVILLAVSLLGFPAAVLAHNLLEPAGEILGHIAGVKSVTQFGAIAAFFIAIVFCPVGALIGAAGGLISWGTRTLNAGR